MVLSFPLMLHVLKIIEIIKKKHLLKGAFLMSVTGGKAEFLLYHNSADLSIEKSKKF